jgi:hypothetical protein
VIVAPFQLQKLLGAVGGGGGGGLLVRVLLHNHAGQVMLLAGLPAISYEAVPLPALSVQARSEAASFIYSYKLKKKGCTSSKRALLMLERAPTSADFLHAAASSALFQLACPPPAAGGAF